MPAGRPAPYRPWRSLRALDHADQGPSLGLGQGTALLDRHQIAFATFVTLIVSMQFGSPPNVLSVNGMLNQPLDGNGDRLIHFVAGHAPGQRALRLLRFRCHALLAFSLNTILTRAMLRRACRKRWGLLAWPVARCIRRLNCSRNSASNSCLNSSTVFCRSSLAFLSGSRKWSALATWPPPVETPRGRHFQARLPPHFQARLPPHTARGQA